MLQVESLVRRIADFEVRATFTVSAGERLALRGRSGSGKTSLLRTLAGLDPAQGGRVRLEGRDLTRIPVERRGVGYVFQEHALFPTMDVLDNVAFGLEMQGLPPAERRARARRALDSAGMGTLASASVVTLSGGEKGRVALLRAFVSRPRYLLLDEPFAALDPATRDQMRRLVVELHQGQPTPLVIVTHDAEDVAQVATRSLSLRETGSVRAWAST